MLQYPQWERVGAAWDNATRHELTLAWHRLKGIVFCLLRKPCGALIHFSPCLFRTDRLAGRSTRPSSSEEKPHCHLALERKYEPPH